jgi:hypothetical protein
VLTCRLISDLENPYADLSQYNDYAAPNDDADRDDDYVEDISDNEVSYSALGSTRFTSHLDFASCANALAADVLQQHAPRGQASGPEGIRAFRVHGRLAARLRLLHRLQQDVCRPEVRCGIGYQAPASMVLHLTVLMSLRSRKSYADRLETRKAESRKRLRTAAQKAAGGTSTSSSRGGKAARGSKKRKAPASSRRGMNWSGQA